MFVFASTQYILSCVRSTATPFGQRTDGARTTVWRWDPSIPARSILGSSPQSVQNSHLDMEKREITIYLCQNVEVRLLIWAWWIKFALTVTIAAVTTTAAAEAAAVAATAAATTQTIQKH